MKSAVTFATFMALSILVATETAPTAPALRGLRINADVTPMRAGRQPARPITNTRPAPTPAPTQTLEGSPTPPPTHSSRALQPGAAAAVPQSRLGRGHIVTRLQK